MKINTASIILKNLPELNLSSLLLGEKVNAKVIENLGNGYYIVKLKEAKVKVHSNIPLKDNEIFMVSEKIAGKIVLKPLASSSAYSVSNLISGYPLLSGIESPIVSQIIYFMLKKNVRINESNVLKLYNAVSKSGVEKDVNGFILRFLINLISDGVQVTPDLIKKLVVYKNLLSEKKHSFKNKSKRENLSDNKKEEIFSKKEKKSLFDFITEINSLMNNGDMRGGYYFILPFITQEEEFYSEIKFFYEKNALGEMDYSVSANLHFSTGEVKLRGTYIGLYIYLKLYFENEGFLNLCKENYVIKDERETWIKSVKFFPMAKLDVEDEVLFSDIYYKDENIEFA